MNNEFDALTKALEDDLDVEYTLVTKPLACYTATLGNEPLYYARVNALGRRFYSAPRCIAREAEIEVLQKLLSHASLFRPKRQSRPGAEQ